MLIVQCAGVAQLVELLICNQPVAGSSPVTSFFLKPLKRKALGNTYCCLYKRFEALFGRS